VIAATVVFLLPRILVVGIRGLERDERYFMTFEALQKRYEWVPIRDCPGRSVLRGVDPKLSLTGLLGDIGTARSFVSAEARDVLWVVPLEGGGVLSYGRADGTWLHTLNTPDGLKRKLAQLQIPFDGALGSSLG
jgi:hypothetical protein